MNEFCLKPKTKKNRSGSEDRSLFNVSKSINCRYLGEIHNLAKEEPREETKTRKVTKREAKRGNKKKPKWPRGNTKKKKKFDKKMTILGPPILTKSVSKLSNSPDPTRSPAPSSKLSSSAATGIFSFFLFFFFPSSRHLVIFFSFFFSELLICF